MSLKKVKTPQFPDLPKKINRREEKVDGLVAKRLVKLNINPNWLLEVKMKGNKLLSHQKVAQKQVQNGTFLWKPPDFGARNPGDYIRLGDADAIVCVVDGKHVSCETNGIPSHTFRL